MKKIEKILLVSLGLTWVAAPVLAKSNYKRPPVPYYGFTVAELTDECRLAVQRFEAQVLTIESTPRRSHNFTSVVVALDHAWSDLFNETKRFRFMSQVSPYQEMRDAAQGCEEAIDSAEIRVYARRDLALAVKRAEPQGAAGIDELRLYDDYRDRFVNNGALYPEVLYRTPDYQGTVKDFYVSRLERLSEIRTQFRKNANEDTTVVEATREELEGVAEGVIDEFEQNEEGRYLIPVGSRWYEILRSAHDADLRRRILLAYENRAAEENLPLVREAMKIFAERAKVSSLVRKPKDGDGIEIEFPVYADYFLEGGIAGDQRGLNDFWLQISEGLPERRDREYEAMAEIKKQLAVDNPQVFLTEREFKQLLAWAELGFQSYEDALEKVTAIKPWDVYYYPEKWAQIEFQSESSDDEYFTWDALYANTFTIYEELFGIQIVEEDLAECDGCVWITSPGGFDAESGFIMRPSSSVRLFRVINHDADFGVVGKTIGFFYLDPFARENKFKRYFASTQIQGSHDRSGSRITPVSVLAGLWSQDTNSHYQVRTFFHEFGHVMHHLLTEARFFAQAGSYVIDEFRETPSQTLENWMMTPQGLERVASKEVPEGVIEKWQQTPRFTKGAVYWSRQLFYAKVHMALRYMKIDGLDVVVGQESDPMQVWREIYQQTTGLEPMEGTSPVAGFEQLFIGAAYYAYAWSYVYAEEMFSRFKEEGLFNPDTGRDYRRHILAPGSSRHPEELVKAFLGRNEISIEPFLDSIRVTAAN